MTNPNDAYIADDFRMLKPEAFDFVFSNELKRAVRSQNFVTLVVLEPLLRGGAAGGAAERDAPVLEVARLVSREVRETDLLAHTGQGRLSVVLLDADLQNSLQVIERLMARLEHYQFERPLTFEVGAACCPTHGADAESLKRAAEAHPVPTRGHQSNAH
jgi:GGDEF domain-containing protein